MQEIKLQNYEQRKRWEWEDTQAGLFEINTQSLKLRQVQESGDLFINESKNIIITSKRLIPIRVLITPKMWTVIHRWDYITILLSTLSRKRYIISGRYGFSNSLIKK